MRMVFPIGINMKKIIEEIFPVTRDIDDHIDNFEEFYPEPERIPTPPFEPEQPQDQPQDTVTNFNTLVINLPSSNVVPNI